MSNESLEVLIIDYLSVLDRDEFIHVTAMLDDKDSLNTLVGEIKKKLINQKLTIEQAVQDIELSFYEN